MKRPSEAACRRPLRLRSAVERLLCERATTTRPAELRCLPPPAGSELDSPPRRRRRSRLSLSITLRDDPLMVGALPTADLLDAALAVITQGRHQPGDWRLEAWFFRLALRAIAEAILEAGHIPLPLAVRLECHPHKEAWPAMPRIQLPAPLRQVRAQRQPGEPLRFLVRLEEPCCAGESVLADEIDAALRLLGSGHHPPGSWRQERWFLRVALRAVCEGVLTSQAGHLPLPLRARFRPQTTFTLPAWHAQVRALALAAFYPRPQTPPCP